MPFDERKAILEQLSSVDQVIDFVDDDIGSAINALKKLKNFIPMMISLSQMEEIEIKIISPK